MSTKYLRPSVVLIVVSACAVFGYAVYGETWRINFQPSGVPTPIGYLLDSGGPYDQVSGYGWVAAAPTSTPIETPTEKATSTPTRPPTATQTPTPVGTPNILLNPSFENSPELVHWTEVGVQSKIGWTTLTAKYGTHSCAFSDPTSDYSARGVRSDTVAVSQGGHYSFGGWFRVAGGSGIVDATNFRLRLEWRNSGGTVLSTYPGTTGFSLAAFNQWEEKEHIDVTAPVNAASMSLIVEVNESMNNDNDAYMEEFYFRIYLTPTPTVTPTPTKMPDLVHVRVNQVCPFTTPGEYVELYNSGDAGIDLGGYRLDVYQNDYTFLSGAVIPARGYFLVSDTNPVAGVSPDVASDINITDNSVSSSVRLIAPGSQVVDTIGWDESTVYEGTRLPHLTDGYAWRRKAAGADTDDNLADFEKVVPDPRNASFILTPSPTPTATPLPGEAGDVVVNEVVTCPINDWSDSSGAGAGVSFDTVPGTGTVDDDDEWIELYNASGHELNLTGWSIVMIDLSTQEQGMGEGDSTVWRFSTGSSLGAFQASGYLVAGNPQETLSDDVYIEIRNAYGAVIDTVEIGDDPEGDGAGDGAPWGSDRGGRASHADAESIGRSPNARRTGNDTADFKRLPATIGGPNPNVPEVPLSGGVLINEVVVDPKYDWSDSSGGNGVPFDAVPGSGVPDTGDQWIELYNVLPGTLDLAGWRLRITDDTGQTFGVELGSDMATLSFSDGSSLGALQGGGHMVTGGVVRAMTFRLHIELLGPGGEAIDAVEIGDDPRGDGEGNCAPRGVGSGGESGLEEIESVGRTPNGSDTGSDVSDFALLPATICGANITPGTASPSSMVVNEVVTDPKHDWSDTENGAGVPFDAVPGTGVPGAGDQWIELHNTTDTAVDLTGWTIAMIDDTPETQAMGGGESTYLFIGGEGFSAFPAGGYLVIGDPAGEMAGEVVIELRDGMGTLIDRVQLGREGAPDGGANGGKSSDAIAESVVRIPDGVDTGTDATDFMSAPASPGQENPSPPHYAVGSVLINEAVTWPEQDWSDTAGEGVGVSFDAQPGTGVPDLGDQWIELYNVSGGAVNLAGWTVTMTDSSPETQSIGGGRSVYRLSSGGSLSAFTAGGYLVMGDPIGIMAHNVVIELKDAWEALIDKVEIGGAGAPSGVGSGVGDEAVARVPNGADTGSDASDFGKAGATIGGPNPSSVPTPTATPTAGPTATPTITPTPTVTPTPVPMGDTDGDGIMDYDEITIYGTDPGVADTDGDGVDDGAERDYWEGRGEDFNDPSHDDGDETVNLLLDMDSEGDGANDGAEIAAGTDPLNPDNQPPMVTITSPAGGQVFN